MAGPSWSAFATTRPGPTFLSSCDRPGIASQDGRGRWAPVPSVRKPVHTEELITRSGTTRANARLAAARQRPHGANQRGLYEPPLSAVIHGHFKTRGFHGHCGPIDTSRQRRVIPRSCRPAPGDSTELRAAFGLTLHQTTSPFSAWTMSRPRPAGVWPCRSAVFPNLFPGLHVQASEDALIEAVQVPAVQHGRGVFQLHERPSTAAGTTNSVGGALDVDERRLPLLYPVPRRCLRERGVDGWAR